MHVLSGKKINIKNSVVFCGIFLFFNIFPAIADEPLNLLPIGASEPAPVENIAPDSAIIKITETVGLAVPPAESLSDAKNADDIILAANQDEPIKVLIPTLENNNTDEIDINLPKDFASESGIIIEAGDATVLSKAEETQTPEVLTGHGDYYEDNITATSASSSVFGIKTVLKENVVKIGTTTNVNLSPTVVSISSGIVRRAVVNGSAILASWQMLVQKAEHENFGSDDSHEAGAQILPSGQYKTDKTFAVCALVADAQTKNISVTARIAYPKDFNFKIDGKERLGGQLKNNIILFKMDQAETDELFCKEIRNGNNNLPKWNKDETFGYTYDYEQICGQEGLLAMNNAKIYCGDTALAYNDPAGLYEITYNASDELGKTKEFKDYMKYLELTMFENDFSDVQYGPTDLNEWKTLKGDVIWGSANAPTVRNIGNTRLKIKIKQNDFGFGKSGIIWNLLYQARVGKDAPFSEYLPEQIVILKNSLDLGEMTNIDFSVLVKNFPEDNGIRPVWDGELLLLAEKDVF